MSRTEPPYSFLTAGSTIVMSSNLDNVYACFCIDSERRECTHVISGEDGSFVFTHLLLGFWVLAQLVEIASQLVLYRRSA